MQSDLVLCRGEPQLEHQQSANHGAEICSVRFSMRVNELLYKRLVDEAPRDSVVQLLITHRSQTRVAPQPFAKRKSEAMFRLVDDPLWEKV